MITFYKSTDLRAGFVIVQELLAPGRRAVPRRRGGRRENLRLAIPTHHVRCRHVCPSSSVSPVCQWDRWMNGLDG